MAKCRDCRWYKTDIGNPTKGMCIHGSYKAEAKDAAGGTASTVITGKIVNGSDEECENYESKKGTSRSQRLKEGM
ncbi:MAG: hypothetical protein DRH08_00405 [Deltaproteobacteria bacterium]|nr:MAG: hypothetical protein DRH08_00405 [Deltaproteobacteria bacterium]